MIDPYQIQEDNYLAALSAPQLATVNMVNERKFELRSDLETDAIWMTQRNGRSGNGVLFEELIIDSKLPNAPAPIFVITFPMVCFQNGDSALLPNVGGGFRAQNLAMMILDLFFQWSRSWVGIMTLDGRCWEKARDYPFINAIRVSPKIEIAASALTQRCAFVTSTVAGGLCTMVCTTPGATVVYTLDGSFPANPAIAIEPISGKPANPNALIYGEPFAVASGQIVRAIAYANGFNMGPERKFAVS